MKVLDDSFLPLNCFKRIKLSDDLNLVLGENIFYW